MLDKLCKELGVEINETWYASDENYYKIEEDSILIKFKNNEDWYVASSYVYKHILLGLIKPVWKPENGKLYYIPNINVKDESLRFHARFWNNDEQDNYYYTNNLAFKTIEEAVECANRMLDVVQSDK